MYSVTLGVKAAGLTQSNNNESSHWLLLNHCAYPSSCPLIPFINPHRGNSNSVPAHPHQFWPICSGMQVRMAGTGCEYLQML